MRMTRSRETEPAGTAREPVLAVPDALRPVLEALRALEPLFHSAHLDASTEAFERFVAPQFWEVGASGHRYGRAFVRKVLAERPEPPDAASWRTDDWHVEEAGSGVYLLTYTLHQPGRVTRRLSVWRRAGAEWQVVYHQGTVVQG